MLFLFITFLSVTPTYAGQYDEAIRVTTDATLKATGLEQRYLTYRGAAEREGRNWLKENHLQKPIAVAAFGYNYFVKDTVRIHSHGFTFTSDSTKKQLTWGFQF